ncbi:phage holin [Salipaludibacillus sp. HK11]|uniref:phage holin n=1 Tax=Salipaludibacillus sp. HK11 TaxID=3394320 RepID=UPI0039FCE228
MKEKVKQIDNKWVRLVVMILVAGNAIAMMFGVELLPFNDDQIIAGVSASALVVSEMWNHWRNNSYSEEAKEADLYLETVKELKEDDLKE